MREFICGQKNDRPPHALLGWTLVLCLLEYWGAGCFFTRPLCFPFFPGQPATSDIPPGKERIVHLARHNVVATLASFALLLL